MAGLQREGLKASEVFLIVKHFTKMMEDGEDEAIAYTLACRMVPGATPETFAKWKPDILKLAKGEDTPALSLLSGSASPGTPQAPEKNPEFMKRFKQLGERLDTLEGDHARLSREKETAVQEIARLREENEALKRARLLEGGEAPKGGGKPK